MNAADRSASGAPPDLLARAAAGEVAAFAEFYDETVNDFLRWFLRRTAAADTAADLTAETYAKALESLHRYDQAKSTNPAAWLQGIARHELLGWLRQREVEQRATARLRITFSDVHEDDLDLVALRVDLEHFGSRLTDALDELGRPTRKAVELRVMAGLPYKQVASRLNCSEGAARVRVSRGLARLWDLLGEQVADE